jgi:amino acid transporter
LAVEEKGDEVSKSEGGQSQLARGVLTQTEVLFQAITHLGPAGAAIVLIPFITQFVGPGVPFILLLCLVAILLTGLNVAALARHLPSASGYYSYVSHGLGRRLGFFTAWAYFLYDPLIPFLSIMVSAGILEQVFQEKMGVYIPWWATTVILLAMVHWVTFMGVKPSAQFTVVLGLAESIIIVLLSIAVIAHVGVDAQSITPFEIPPMGAQSLFLAFSFTILMFCGFESAAPLAEETANPRRAIPRTVIISLITVGGMWVLAGYAVVVGFGVDDAAQIAYATNPFFSLADQVWSIGWILVAFALINSSLAAAVAGQNAGSRVIFALGRASVLPPVLGKIHPKHKTPYVAITVQSLLNIGLGLALGFWLGPMGALGFAGLLVALGTIIVYTLGNVAVIPLYWRRYRDEWHLVRHVLVPVAATALLAIAFYYSVWPLPPFPMYMADVIVVIWLVLGALLAVYLGGSRRNALEKAAEILYEEGEEARSQS